MMKRYLGILLCAAVVIALVSGTALAGTLKVNHSTNATYLMSLQALGTARDFTIATTQGGGASAGNSYTDVAVGFKLGQSLAASSFLNITLTGAKFKTGQDYALCAQNNGSEGGTPSTGVANIKIGGFQGAAESVKAIATTSATNANVNATNFIALVNGTVCSNVGVSNTLGLLTLTADTASATGSISANASISAGGTTYDGPSTATVATIMNQFAYGTPTGTTHTIDYLYNAKNGTQFDAGAQVAVNSANTTGALSLSRSAVDLGVSTATAVNVSALLTLVDSQNWAGVKRVYLMGQGVAGTACDAATNKAGSNNFTGVTTLNLTIDPANLPQTTAAGTMTYPLCVDVTGSTVLDQRTIKGTPDIVVAANGVDLAAGNQATLQTWSVNAFQAVVPYLVADTAYKTICLVDNTDLTSAATIYMDVLGTTSGTTTSKTVGTVAAKTVKRVDLATSITPWTTGSGTDAEDTPNIQALGLTAGERYAAKFTVTSNPDKIHLSCFQVDGATNTKRAVPVLKLTTFYSGSATTSSTGWTQ